MTDIWAYDGLPLPLGCPKCGTIARVGPIPSCDCGYTVAPLEVVKDAIANHERQLNTHIPECCCKACVQAREET